MKGHIIMGYKYNTETVDTIGRYSILHQVNHYIISTGRDILVVGLKSYKDCVDRIKVFQAVDAGVDSKSVFNKFFLDK